MKTQVVLHNQTAWAKSHETGFEEFFFFSRNVESGVTIIRAIYVLQNQSKQYSAGGEGGGVGRQSYQRFPYEITK